jgi:hypothetical protein
MTQAESKAAVPAGVQQEQLEAEERRRSVVLFLVGLAAAIFVFWLGVFHLMAGGRVFRVVGVLRGLRVGMWFWWGITGLRNFLCGLRLARWCGGMWLFATRRTATCL